MPVPSQGSLDALASSQGKRLNLGLAAGTVDADDQDRATSFCRRASRRIGARRGGSASTCPRPRRGQAGAAPYDDEGLTDEDPRAIKGARAEPATSWSDAEEALKTG